MKTAVYVQDGVAQIVLTPESRFEQLVLGNVGENPTAETYRGSFYDCQGGWIRSKESSDQSLIIKLSKTQKVSLFEGV